MRHLALWRRLEFRAVTVRVVFLRWCVGIIKKTLGIYYT